VLNSEHTVSSNNQIILFPSLQTMMFGLRSEVGHNYVLLEIVVSAREISSERQTLRNVLLKHSRKNFEDNIISTD